MVELVGAVDIDKSKMGKDVSQLLNNQRKTGITVSEKAKDILKRTSPDIVTHATSSYVKTNHPQLTEIIEDGANVVSTAEELSYPFVKHPELSKEIDEIAKTKNVAVLGTGVNPGFLLDTLPVALSGVCQKSERDPRGTSRRCHAT